MDPYKVLGVTRWDSDEEIRRKYRQLSKKYHPDVYLGSDIDFALKMMQKVNQAYDEIISERKSGFTTATTGDNAADFWTTWVAWAQAYETQNKQQTRGTKRNSEKTEKKQTKNTNRTAYFRRAGGGVGSYRVANSDKDWNRRLLDLDKETLSELLRDIRFDIFEELKKYNGTYDGIFSKGIYHRILAYAAAEYIDPIDCIKKTLKTDNIDGCELSLIFDSFRYIDTLGLSVGELLTIDFDSQKHKDPFAISIYTKHGVYLGTNDSSLATYLSLLHASGKASFFARISNLTSCKRYNRTTREYIDDPAISVSIQISLPNEASTERLLIDNRKKIDDLLQIYAKYVKYSDEYFEKYTFSTEEAIDFLEQQFVSVESNSSEYELCYHLSFPIDTTRRNSLTYQQVTRLSTYAPIYYEKFSVADRKMLFSICNACLDGEAVKSLISIGKNTLSSETDKYQFVITLRKQPKGHTAVGIYIYSKDKYFFLHTAEQRHRKKQP